MLLGAATLIILPAAIALACLPKAAIGFDKANYTYNPGDTVTVTGYQLSPRSPVVMKLQAPSGELTTVGTAGKVTDDTGAFTDSIALPSNAASGDYVVGATAGQRTASQTFTVEPTAGAAVPPLPGLINPPSNTNPPGPTAPSNPPVNSRSRAALRKAIARCNRKFRSKSARGSAERKLTNKRRAACVKKATKRYP